MMKVLVTAALLATAIQLSVSMLLSRQTIWPLSNLPGC
jgi:hypothetical protein